MIKHLLFLFCAATSICLFSQQNLKVDYKALKSEGILPDIFTRDIKETVNHDISEITKEDADKKLKEDYLLITNYAIEQKVKSGNTLINDEMTLYINQIVDVIL